MVDDAADAGHPLQWFARTREALADAVRRVLTLPDELPHWGGVPLR
jgi:hypothetical protein